MSCWTHITACISCETGIEEPKRELLRQVKTYLGSAPAITGSERDADLFVNIQSGYNIFVSADCDHCEYKDTQIIRGKGEFDCFPPDDYKCKSAKYQDAIVISIQGDLRDRMKEQTQKEFDTFLEYVKKEYWVRDYAVNIEGDY